ncbi:DmsC/YnfH family molybdoenzyme membrane anchor subunit, partial [Escherichia coli]|uniref:DmsC/YnfH family molybdoenzyme membrane anchor subunit n=1 Tax=Escherichia coli TaxID=562 RepID=UPI000B956067
MGNGWHEWPLVIFTVLGQCVVGALIVREGANKRGNSSRLTQSFHFFMFEPI